MHSPRKAATLAAFYMGSILAVGTSALAGSLPSTPAPQAAAQAPAAKQVVGTVKAVSGNTLTLAPDAGAEISVTVADSTRIVRVAPGQTDVKNAPAIQLSDLQTGDRILVRGKLSDDGKSLVASNVIAMKRTDVEAKQQRDREDWQKRGIGGLVSSVDAGTVTISVAAPGGSRNVAIHVTKATILRRYAADSVQFDDASASALDAIKPGDQLRARGTRSADGSEFSAEEIVSGIFRNIAGTIKSLDASAGTMNVTDLVTKKVVLVKVTPQSQVLKLTPQVAQGLAARLKGGAAGAPGGGAPAAAGAVGAPPAAAMRAGGNGPGGGGGQADLQQVVSRMPPAKLTDLQQGDAVMIVSTEGTASGGVTAITLLGGVEPILQAAPGSAAMTLSPWNIGGAPDAGDAAQ